MTIVGVRELGHSSASSHLADIDELIVARAVYQAAGKRWPGDRTTLRQDTRVIEDSTERPVMP